jgi:hypothetical protein
VDVHTADDRLAQQTAHVVVNGVVVGQPRVKRAGRSASGSSMRYLT